MFNPVNYHLPEIYDDFFLKKSTHIVWCELTPLRSMACNTMEHFRISKNLKLTFNSLQSSVKKNNRYIFVKSANTFF